LLVPWAFLVADLAVPCERGKAEPLGRRPHLERLVGSLGVVAVHPRVERLLSGLQRSEGASVQELLSKALWNRSIFRWWWEIEAPYGGAAANRTAIGVGVGGGDWA
jgi:hypothetical protein